MAVEMIWQDCPDDEPEPIEDSPEASGDQVFMAVSKATINGSILTHAVQFQGLLKIIRFVSLLTLAVWPRS